MTTLSNTDLIAALNWRYAVKQFDPSRKISAADWSALEDALVLSPSSYGMQPWKFFVVDNADLRARLRPHSWNQSQITDASHLVVFGLPEKIDEASVDRFIARIAEVRGIETASIEFYRQMILKDVIHGPRSAWVREWAARQIYIALGNLMTSAAVLGIDTCPLEGLDPREYDAILGLPERGFNTVVACALGYRSADDKYASLPKVRFPKSDMLVTL
jgi:nitroreductase